MIGLGGSGAVRDVDGDGTLRYEYGQIENAAHDVDSFVRAIQSRIDEVDQVVRNLQAGWDGDAWAAYRAKQADMNSKLSEVAQLIGRLGPALREAEAAMRAKDASLANMFGG
jgi:early secretory antigenic target protein ESAT-6